MDNKLEKYVYNILNICDGDYKFVNELCNDLLNLFSNDTFEKLRYQIENKDKENLLKTVHKLKGAVSHFNIDNTIQQLEEIETIGKNGDFHNAKENIKKIEANIEKFRQTVYEFYSS